MNGDHAIPRTEAVRSPAPEMDQPRPVPVALEVWGNDYRQILDTAVAADELGFSALYYGESPHGLNLETFMVLAAVATHTTTIRIGPVIANLLPGYRSFPLLVRQIHALSVISDGRVDLRTGTGASARWAAPWWRPAGIDYPGRATRRALLAEWLAAFQHVWGSRTGGFRGEHLHFDQILLEPPVERPPVTVAAMGPKSMRIAAAYSDVWEASFLDPEEYRVLARRFDRLAGEGHRRLTRALEVDAIAAATNQVRHQFEQRFLAERDAAGPAALAKALFGPADAIAEKMAAYIDVGVEQFLAACVDPHDIGGLAVLAQAAALASTHDRSAEG